MKEAALRYSPEMAEAFQKTFTERPATKKSLAVCEIRVAQRPRPMVTRTITATNATGIQANSLTAHLLLHLLRRPHEIRREQPRDRVEHHPQEEPRGAEAGDPRLRQRRHIRVHQ